MQHWKHDRPHNVYIFLIKIDGTMSFCLSGCPDNQKSTHISAIIKARVTKFGMKVAVYPVPVEFISNVGCHAYRPRKSIIIYLC